MTLDNESPNNNDVTGTNSHHPPGDRPKHEKREGLQHKKDSKHRSTPDHSKERNKKSLLSHKLNDHNGHTDKPSTRDGKKRRAILKRSDSSLSAVSARSGKSSVTISEHPKRPPLSAKSRRIQRKWRSITSRAASLVGSVASVDSRGRPKTFPIWPEFTENDIASEKWESASKGKEKGKSPSLSSFEDPEGKLELPSSIKVHEWKRPVDFLEGKTPVILDDNEGDFDLLRPNEHLCHSELMRCIIGQITSLWNISASKTRSTTSLSARNSATPEPGEDNFWRPWEHIYAMTKLAKGPNIPQYNPYGKYVVKLYWMGCWRKITIDDYMPFDSEGRLLFPALQEDYKLWPMLLAKALIKVAAIDYTNNEAGCEFGDFFVIQCLTGWLPETIPLKGLVTQYVIHKRQLLKQLTSDRSNRCEGDCETAEIVTPNIPADQWYGHLQKVWTLLKDILPEWQRPVEKPKEIITESEIPIAPVTSKKDRLESGVVKPDASVGSAHKGGKGKDGKKKDDREKSKSTPHSARPVSARSVADKSAVEQDSVNQIDKRPETVVFATFSQPEESPARVSVLKEMADASEKLRKVGLSNLHPHPVLLTKTRDIPLKPPPPPPVIPRWKLIRPKKKKMTPSDEPIPEPEPPKPDQWLEITSAFVNHRLNPLPLDPNFVKSRTSPLGPKGSRPSTGATLKGIDEDVEDKPEPPKEDGVFRAQHVSSKRRASTKRDLSSRHKDRRDSAGRASPSVQSHISSARDADHDRESLRSQAAAQETSQQDGRDSAINDLHLEEIKDTKTDVISTESINKTMWMDFEDFCMSFQTLVIFHKPATYTCNRLTTEIKHSMITGAPSGGTSSKKGSANATQAGSNTNLKGSAYQKEEERAPSFLFVDNVSTTELVVSFSVLPRWSGSETERDKKISDNQSITGVSEVASVKETSTTPVPTGLLVAEPYSWKSLVVGQPILRIRTTGTRAACLTLPPGRHVLRFYFDTPLGYSLNICSSVNFVYGDEESVMKPLLEESCRFVHTAISIMQGIGKCIEAMGDMEAWNNAKKELHKSHMPYTAENKAELIKHYGIWHRTFYDTMAQLMAENKVPALAFALRSFNFDLSPQPMGILGDPREPIEPHESWANRTPTEDELKAIKKIQGHWRGALARRMRRVITRKDSTEHLTAKDVLNTAWQIIQPNLEPIGLKLLRSMLKEDPSLLEKYPFHKDEWNKISYADFAGTYDDQPPNTWFVMFREIFTVEEDMLCVPKLYTPLRTCSLRVVDNDTGTEIMRVFQKVAPHIYQKNKRGYTFICEARSLETPIVGGKWRLRLIGSSSPLPQPMSGQVNYHFKVKDNNGYYVPNEKNIILRHHVKTKSDMIGTIQLQTAKPDVYVKLQVLDHEVEIASAQGKGHCVIPAFYFLSDEKSDDRASSRLSHQESKALVNQPSKLGISGKKRTGSAKSKDGKPASPKQSRKDSADAEKLSISKPDGTSVGSEDIGAESVIPHKYTIQAIVERNSWPLPESQWAFVQKLREQEKEEIKVYTGKRKISVAKKSKQDRPGSPSAKVAGSGGKTSAAPDKGKKGKGDKGAKEKKTHDKESGSRPPSQVVYDSSKPYWILNVVVDDEKADDVEVKKDIDRQEQIKAEKRAWEAQQPGRAVKALQARLAYLEKSTKKVEKDSDKENEEEGMKSEELSEVEPTEPKDEVLTLHPPRPPTPKIILNPLDLTPYYRPKMNDEVYTQYLDDDVSTEKDLKEKNIVNQYEKERQAVMDWREKERCERYQLKINQLKTFQEMQNKLDDARAELRKPREAYRQTLLEEEQRRKEEEEEKAAALLAAQENNSGSVSPKGKKSAGKKKK
uniref:androglobin-like isoform X1 n=1 Tax=Styela clava TaxID=7725 RepID=UPI00193A82AC|nr:androglobin-like isoform X1 [Styela clava]